MPWSKRIASRPQMEDGDQHDDLFSALGVEVEAAEQVEKRVIADALEAEKQRERDAGAHTNAHESA